MAILHTDGDIVRVLRLAKRLAILGAHSAPSRAAFYVPDYLARHGFRVVPVNPRLVGEVIWGESVRATLAEVGEVDGVVVFRRAEDLANHLPEILAMSPRPWLVWQQLGIVNRSFSTALADAGLDVVEDRCMLQDHRTFGDG